MPPIVTEFSIDNILSACVGAYSSRTLKGYSSDLRVFLSWCLSRPCNWLPANPQAVADFVDDQVAQHCISTIKRRLCAIAFAHRMRDLPVPVDANVVRLAVRRATRQRASRPKQVRGLTNAIRSRVTDSCPGTVAGIRDAALISVGYDTLCRSSELSAMHVEHMRFANEGTATLLIPRTKSDPGGAGRVAHLSPESTALLARWLEVAKLEGGPLFRSLHLGRPHEGPLATSSIRRIIKRVTLRAGIDAKVAGELSGHSMRIGAAQDMMVAGFDALAIMQAGGWKSASVVLRYVENASTRELHERRWRQIGSGPGATWRRESAPSLFYSRSSVK
jgi:integrase/recombinase XerD